MLMFAAAIALRYKMKDTPRPFRLGKGNGLMWVMGAVGFGGSLLAFVLSFIPPSQIQTVVIPYVIYAMRKPSWRDPNAEFAPFHSEKIEKNS